MADNDQEIKPWSTTWLDRQPGIHWEQTAPGTIVLRVPVAELSTWLHRVERAPMGIKITIVPVGAPYIDTAFLAVGGTIFNEIAAELTGAGWVMATDPADSPSGYWWRHPASPGAASILAAYLISRTPELLRQAARLSSPG